MSLEFYFASSAKVWSSIDWVTEIKDAGYSGWEISADGNYKLNVPERYKAIKDMLETTGLKASVHAPFADLNLASMNYPIYRESIKQLCECVTLAADITDRVTIHPGYLSPAARLVPDKVWTLHKEALIEIGKTALDCGVVACLENMPMLPDFLCMDPDEISGMISGVDGFALTIDFGHANTVGKVDDFLKIIDQAKHIHIHDNVGKKDEHFALGEGNINWKKVFDVLKKHYSGICVVEGRSIEEAKRSSSVIKRYL